MISDSGSSEISNDLGSNTYIEGVPMEDSIASGDSKVIQLDLEEEVGSYIDTYIHTYVRTYIHTVTLS
jgi:hypothetical protein